MDSPLVVPVKTGTSHPCPCRSLRPLGEGEDEGSGDRKCNEMQPNATEIKVLPLLPTPDELHNEDASPAPSPVPAITATRPDEATMDPNEATPGLMVTSEPKIE